MLRRTLAVAALSLPLAAFAADPEFSLVIQDHRFQPAELTIPADVKIKLKVENRDSTPEEFESHSLNREKVIPGKSSLNIFIGPLKPGRYPFYGEFNEKTAQGAIVVK
ncbi:MAG TPA: cupredoxin domain-containing protein [Rhodocyclaceae bacterium]